MSIAAPKQTIPVVGLILITNAQGEHGKRPSYFKKVCKVVHSLSDAMEIAPISIDTRILGNDLKSPAAVESFIAKMDVIITNRLHGLVLSLRNGVPPVVIDNIEGGAKVTAQASLLGWPIVLRGSSLTLKDLKDAVSVALKSQSQAQRCEILCIQKQTRFIKNLSTLSALHDREPRTARRKNSVVGKSCLTRFILHWSII